MEISFVIFGYILNIFPIVLILRSIIHLVIYPAINALNF